MKNLDAESLIEYIINKKDQLTKEEIISLLFAWIKVNRFDDLW
jgi:hypothetical protein